MVYQVFLDFLPQIHNTKSRICLNRCEAFLSFLFFFPPGSHKAPFEFFFFFPGGYALTDSPAAAPFTSIHGKCTAVICPYMLDNGDCSCTFTLALSTRRWVFLKTHFLRLKKKTHCTHRCNCISRLSGKIKCTPKQEVAL